MDFIRNNILKIVGVFVILLVLIFVVKSCYGRGTTEKATGYTAMENQLQNAAIKYAKRNMSVLPKTTENVSKIQMSTIYGEKRMQKITAIEDKNTLCQGYVNIYKNNTSGYKFVPFIKCGKYYHTKSLVEQILNTQEIVTKDDGLYKDGDDYLYRGEYPNNYMMIGDKLYRIMNITSDNYLRVVSNDYIIDSSVWDDRFNTEVQKEYGINNFMKSRLKKSLEDLFEKENEFISDTEKNVIAKHDYCIGKRSMEDVIVEKNHECDEVTEMYIAVPNVEDYFRASISSECNDINKNECNNYNYFQTMKFKTHTLNSVKNNTYAVYNVSRNGLDIKKANNYSFINIVFYVNNNVIYKSGDGSLENPYVIR